VIERRDFLRTAALAPALLGQEPAPKPAAPFAIGVATYSLRAFDRAKAIAMLKELRVTVVSVKQVHLPLDQPAGAKDFADAGIRIASGGVHSLRKEDEAARAFEYAKACGMPMLVIDPAPELLKTVEKLAKEHDIRAAIHNHGPEHRHWRSAKEPLEAVKDLDPRVGLCIDVGHAARAGADVVAEVAAAGARLLDMHMKDLRDLRKPPYCAVGEGAMPVAAILRELLRIKYAGGVNLEHEIDEKDPLPGMKVSLAYLRGVVAGLQER